MATINKMK